jgi:hypothetical protein
MKISFKLVFSLPDVEKPSKLNGQILNHGAKLLVEFA